MLKSQKARPLRLQILIVLRIPWRADNCHALYWHSPTVSHVDYIRASGSIAGVPNGWRIQSGTPGCLAGANFPDSPLHAHCQEATLLATCGEGNLASSREYHQPVGFVILRHWQGSKIQQKRVTLIQQQSGELLCLQTRRNEAQHHTSISCRCSQAFRYCQGGQGHVHITVQLRQTVRIGLQADAGLQRCCRWARRWSLVTGTCVSRCSGICGRRATWHTRMRARCTSLETPCG